MFEDFIPTAFVFAPGNDDWKKKRKAVAHVFARERLSKMIELLKDQLMVKIDLWLEEIRSSKDK